MPSIARRTRPGRTRRTTRAAAIGAAVAAAAVMAAPAAGAAAPQHATVRDSAPVFVQSDNPTANTVVAYHRNRDGSLGGHEVYPTGGRGGVLDGSVVDHLASQGSLTYDRDRHLLYAVNAGSDSVTVFAVHGDRLERLQVLPSGGDFPVSVTAHGDQVYVLNARSGGSVQGYVWIGSRLVQAPGRHRELHLTEASPEFTHTPGQVGFTPDGSNLVVTTKAADNSIEVFPLDSAGAPAARPVVTPTPDAVPFGFTFDQAGRLQVTYAGPNAVATFTVHRDGTLHQVGQVATGQMATCWIVATGDHLYASNAGSATLSGYRVEPHGPLTPLGTTPTDGGTVDAAASSDGRTVYVQTGAQGIVDEFRVGHGGSLTPIGSVTVPGAVGGEGIAAG
ncbi:lactonase family protein [Actinacidiphila bryophytorum]|uniref:6-phosphogluconolactonase, cycloisomerase 2 family n=1 Tax=Actinacidiphila bryophytorum TaxID=1436133 RepID=A0A9W4GY01_9ACTN|nr:beta-propeller fold lactonase family protein [Actinacidiphila bryophytorum]MBM9434424.1 beta-propeller fold lactonase family protein [Actinacidiphila bryophytorum]MBN6541898.1 beta-propeller fold lactonase family protein [Actinacidiphila bryophytorum]CAG7625911.1 6-phosphogluconolactonase, cycloisomerase 2 family [Actinacidiphila bryophytorum]